MAIKKQYLKTKPVCKVTFSLSTREAKDISKAAVVGEFNGWDKGATIMKKQKAGGFATNLDLEKGREYQFRYLINGDKWSNDKKADKFAPTPFGEENSVIVL
jgi:1,4-alpha-glucan branching enzyme